MWYENICDDIIQCFSNCGPRTTSGPLRFARSSAAVSEEKVSQKLYQTLNERKIRPYMSVLKLSMSVGLQQKVSELCEISGSHGCKYEVQSRLGCTAV
jgi:hypothetical protein